HPDQRFVTAKFYRGGEESRQATFPDQNGNVSADDGSDDGLLVALRAGDEGAFRAVVTRHHGAMVRVASYYVRSQAVAEEVTQETWLAVINGLGRFEGRSSLRTWIFRIL